MKPTFTTDRLDVFRLACERGEDPEGETFYDCTMYFGFQREAATVHPWHHIVHCATITDGCVCWIETHHSGLRKGYADELLRGIVEHEKRDKPLYADLEVNEASERLFEKHEQWFEARQQQLIDLDGFDEATSGEAFVKDNS